MKRSFNDIVAVRPNALGRYVFNAYHARYGLDAAAAWRQHARADGRLVLPLHELFRIFGEAIGTGLPLPFENTEIEFTPEA